MDDFEPKRGRPKTGHGVQVNLRWPVDLMARVDAFAESEFISRADALRALVERGLGDDDRS